MKSGVFGSGYGVAHTPDTPPLQTDEGTTLSSAGLAPLHYLRLGFHIAMGDGASIRRASRDSNALAYGVALWVISGVAILLRSAVPAVEQLRYGQLVELTIGALASAALMLAFMGVIVVIRLGLCHVIAKWLFHGSGTFAEVMRPILLAWFVNCLVLIPAVGILAAMIAWTVVLMTIFQEFYGISRLQAFTISAVASFCFTLLQVAVPQLRF